MAVNDMTAITPRLHLKREPASLQSTACTLKSTICSNKQRTLKKKQRRQWLTLPDLLMSSELNKTIPAAKKRPNVLWKLKLLNLKTVLLKPMKWLLREAVTLWLNSKEESVRWKWNWEEFNLRHPKLASPTKNLSVASRN